MKPKYQRLCWIVLGLASIATGVTLLAYNFKDNIVFFYSPKELSARAIPPEKTIRIGGMVKDGSVEKNGLETHFTLTDYEAEIAVTFTGMLPDLFREGQGIVATGTLSENTFTATNLLAKHDENYMPPALKKSLSP